MTEPKMLPQDASSTKEETPLRVLLVATSFPRTLADWRGLFIRHVTDALNRRPELRLSIWAPEGETEQPAGRSATRAETRLLANLMQLGGIAHLLRTNRMKGGWFALRLLHGLWKLYRRSRDVDVYHINWLQNAIPLSNNATPALVTVLGTDMALLCIPFVQSALRRTLRRRRVAICPNASWPVQELQMRFGDIATVRYIPLGIDARWFDVRRTVTNASPNWLVVSRVTRAKLGDLLAWCEPHFGHGQRTLHLVGPMQEQITLPRWVVFHGPADPDTLRDVWFPRVTGLITLSRHAEGRPQVLLEAMASGVPVIASDLAAHVELMETSGGGMVCGSAEALGGLLEHLESGETNRAIGEGGRRWVSTNIGTWDDCAARYLAVYRELQESTPP